MKSDLAPADPSIVESADALPADRVVHGQTYTAVGRTPYTTKTGREMELVMWRSQCATCGASFDVTIGEHNPRFSPSRRCPEHRFRSRIRHADGESAPAVDAEPMYRNASAEERRKRRAAAVRSAFAADPTLERSFDGWLPDYLLPPEVL